ncbi:MAG: flagellar protein FlgN [Candidatus Sumerlaeota bacterium]|nr:flagellar protein FlgN [Candidatus Sumerlaeota bacterium]
MSSPYRGLVSILERELELHRRLADLLDEEQRALKGLDAERLLVLANEKDGLALQLRALDESRRLLMESIASLLGRDGAEGMRLIEVAAQAPEPEARELMRLRDALRELVETGETRNTTNRYLANHSLETVREAIRALAQADDIHKTYRPKGALRAYRIAPQVVARQV